MSVLIRGMEMPKNCDYCGMNSGLYCKAMPLNFCGHTRDDKRPKWCPLIPLPSEHGRLIERDLLCDEVEGLMQYIRTHRPHNTELTAEEVLQIICRQPIIVMAEGSEE